MVIKMIRKKEYKKKNSLLMFILLTISMGVLAEESLETKKQDNEDAKSHIETIVITAQKRNQNIQDVGISVTALYGDELREQNIEKAVDIEKVIPNMSIKNNGGGSVPIIMVRGVGLQNFRVNDSPTTSFYIDEVYQTSIATASFSMYDLERIEVLKGPQGGLYGRNTIAGAIQIISAKPSLTAGNTGFIDLGIGSFETKEIEFGANFDISENVAARTSGHYNKREDGDDYSAESNEHYGEAERWGLRTQILYEPTDEINFLLKAHTGSMEVELPLLQTLGLYDNIGDAGVFGYENTSLGLLLALNGMGAGLCESVLTGQGTNQQSCATLTGITPENYNITDSHYASASSSVLPYLENSWSGLSLISNVDFNGVTLTSISAYDAFEYYRTQDSDATSVIFLDGEYNTDIDFWSQEFRLTSAPDDSFNWILGASYSEDTLTELSALFGSEGILPLVFGGAINTKQSYKQESDGYSIYGHSTYALTNALGLTTELRYTKENKSFVGVTTLGFAPGFDVPFVEVDDSTSFSDFSGKIGATYTVSDTAMLYGNISKGFKTGGFFGGFATSVEQLAPYDEETILAYELGFKSDLFDNQLRVNGAVFTYDRRDVQANAADPTAVVSIARLTNIGDVETKGAELEVTWVATDDLVIELNLGYTDAYISKSNFVSSTVVPLLGSASVEGANLPNYSKFSANFLALYEHEISEDFSGAIQLEYSYRSDIDLSIILKPEIETAILNEPGVGITNLRYVLHNNNSDWKVIASIENITDEVYRVETTNNGFFGMHERYSIGRTGNITYSYNW